MESATISGLCKFYAVAKIMVLLTRVHGNPTWQFIETQPGVAAIYVTYNQSHFSTAVTSIQVHHAHQGSNLYQKTILEYLVADAEYLTWVSKNFTVLHANFQVIIIHQNTSRKLN